MACDKILKRIVPSRTRLDSIKNQMEIKIGRASTFILAFDLIIYMKIAFSNNKIPLHI